MTSFYDSYDYYKKMLELQEKLRKSEEERIRLEERFKILAQESRNRHDACINRLRLRYIEFLEEQRVRNERSHKLLEALERVDNSLALMTAKTDRLNVLRKQYEAYLRRMYKVPNPSESTIEDSNNVKQHDDTYLRRDATAERIDLSSAIKSSSQLEMFPRNGAVNRSISPSASKWMKSPQSTYRDNCQRSVAQPKSLNQQMNNSQNISRIYSTIPESLNIQLATQSLSLQAFQQKQSNDQNLYTSQLPPSQSSTLIQQIVPHSNKPSFERAETARTVSHIDIPERIKDSISRYKFIDVPPNRFTPIALQHYVRSSSTMQSFRQENDKVSLGDTSKPTRIGTPISQVYTMPVTPERIIRGTSFLNKSINLPRKTVPCYMSGSPKKSDYLRKSATESPARLMTASAVDDIVKRHKRFGPNGSGSPRSSTETREASIEDDERRTAIVVENELDRYIDKIKKLHRDLDAQSLEELDQKQNSHDNILNASLLDDNIEFSNGGQSRGDLPKEVEKVLALANDLAFRTVDLNVASDTGKGCTDENRKLGLVEVTRNDTTNSERTNVMFSDMNEGRETSEPHAKDRISNDIKLPEPKLDSYENIEKPWEQNLSGLGNVLEQHEQESSKTLADADFVAPLDDIVMERKNTEDIVPENVERNDDGIYIAQESNLQEYSFNVAEELEPWDLDILHKRIKEIDSIGDSESQYSGKEIVMNTSELNQNNVEHAEFSSELDSLKNQDVEQDSKGNMNINETDSDSARDRFEQGTEHLEQEASTDKKTEGTSETPALRHPAIEHENNKDTNNVNDVQNENLEEQQVGEQNEFGNEQREECNENTSIADVNQNNEQQRATQGEEYNNQNYYDDSNQAENYTGNYETEYTGVNEEYNYEQNTPYEGNQEQSYDPNVPSEADQQQHYEGNVGYETNEDQSYDQSVAYDANENQGYEEYINQEYVQESNGQYGEYVGEQDDSGNQYEQDPNAQYQEDTNQQYAYTYDQQYALNEEGNAATNQPTEYTAFESNQSDLKQEVDRPNDEQREFQEESGHQEEEKVNKAQNKNETLPPENEPKKKKDVIKSLLDSDTDSTIERNVSNTESDFDFN